jgi:hypothetical protein
MNMIAGRTVGPHSTVIRSDLFLDGSAINVRIFKEILKNTYLSIYARLGRGRRVAVPVGSRLSVAITPCNNILIVNIVHSKITWKPNQGTKPFLELLENILVRIQATTKDFED